VRFALVNPPWRFEGSIYFGCREPHLPLEYGYTRALLEAEGHEAVIVDAQAEHIDAAGMRARVDAIRPDVAVVTTAPSYLFWRCPPPELRIPREAVAALRDVSPAIVVVGPHASTTPEATLNKLAADLAVLGECEEVLTALARTPRDAWATIPSTATRDAAGQVRRNGGSHAANMTALPALRWRPEEIARHAHHHHRFDPAPPAAGAEMEASRGCPYHCTFCAKDNYRDRYRKRPLETVRAELAALVAAGVSYVYFIDEIFLPDEALLLEIERHRIGFGVQTRIDLWEPGMLDLLGRAGCRSIEAGVESISRDGRARLDKRCKLSTDELADRLVHARQTVPFVQATLMESNADDPAEVERWRRRLLDNGVWANEPVPLFPYPGSPDYTRLWGVPDDDAWERAHEHYLASFDRFSDVQEQRPVRLPVLEGDTP
jgi:B12-binding domain/radical SAM domain protein of rhizo-twelve system